MSEHELPPGYRESRLSNRQSLSLLLIAAVALITGSIRAVQVNIPNSDVISAVMMSVGLVVLGVWIGVELVRG